MATQTTQVEPPLVVIVGPTASGKTDVALRLAREFGGEIISADSRAIFRGLDIGTAKPTVEELEGVPYWGIDLVDPGDRFTVVDFKQYTEQKISEIRDRGHIPLLVGGSGLYVDAVIYDFQFPVSQLEKRTSLQSKSMDELRKYCLENNINLPENSKNKRYVINAILRTGVPGKRRDTPIDNTIVVGIATEKSVLDKRIAQRADMIFAQGAVQEAQLAAERFGWDNEAMTGNIYPLIRQYLAGEITHSDMVKRFTIADRRLAKRQMTWFRRSKDILWLTHDGTYKYIAQRLEHLSDS